MVALDERYTIVPESLSAFVKIGPNWYDSSNDTSESLIEELRNEIRVLTATVAEMKMVMQQSNQEYYVVQDLPDNIILDIIKYHSRNIPKDQPLYPSDIAEKYKLDPEKVEELMDELVVEGFFK